MRRRLLPLATLALAACTGQRTAPGAPAAPAAVEVPRVPRTDRYTIGSEEIAQNRYTFSNLYDFINRQHSEWLRPKYGTGRSRAYTVQIYLDGTRFGRDPSALRQLPLTGTALVRWLEPSEAESKYGTDNNAGAIEVWSSVDRVR